MTEHKFCIDCAHHVSSKQMLIIDDNMCGHPSMVDSVTKRPQHSCFVVRGKWAPCGLDGNLFSQRDEFKVLAIEEPTGVRIARRLAAQLRNIK